MVVVRHQDGEWHYLLLRAFQHWDFPKGIVEAGETPLAAACREVSEETTLEALDFRWGEAYLETGPYWRNKVARYYVAEAATGVVALPVNPELGRPEHEEYRWVNRVDAARLVRPRVARVLAWAAALIGDAPDQSAAR